MTAGFFYPVTVDAVPLNLLNPLRLDRSNPLFVELRGFA
jgi:hypothetical protein